jgi:hypothetical protein
MALFSACSYAPMPEALLAEGFCAGILPVAIQQPRSIVSVGVSDFLALERGTESVVLAQDSDGDGLPDTVRALVSSFPGLNHGLTFTSTHLYASNSTQVYRWSYDPVNIDVLGEEAELVISNMTPTAWVVHRRDTKPAPW